MLHKSVGILRATLVLHNLTTVTIVSFVSQIYTGAARDATVKGFELILIFFFFNAQQNFATHAHQCPALIVMGVAAARIDHTTLYSSSRRGKNQQEQRLFQSFLNMPLTFSAFHDEWAPKKYLQLALWPDRPLMHTLTCSFVYYFFFPVFTWKLNKALSIPKCKHILPIHCSTFSTVEQKRRELLHNKAMQPSLCTLSCQLCCCSCSASSPCATIGKQDTKFKLTSMCSFVSTFTTSCDVGIFELVILSSRPTSPLVTRCAAVQNSTLLLLLVQSVLLYNFPFAFHLSTIVQI